MRHFAKGFLIGTLCICLLGLVWLFAFQPRLTAQEAQDLNCLLYTSVGVVRVDDYRLTFCGSGYAGVATILPQAGSHVDGVLWRISEMCIRDRHYSALGRK